MRVWNIFYYMPLDREITIPLILLPEIHAFIKINSANHLCYSTKLTTCINLNQANKQKETLVLLLGINGCAEWKHQYQNHNEL